MKKPNREKFFIGFKLRLPETTNVDYQKKNHLFHQVVQMSNENLHDYEKQHERVVRANKMMTDRVDECMLSDIDEKRNPKEALEHLQSLYRMRDCHAIQFAETRLLGLRLE